MEIKTRWACVSICVDVQKLAHFLDNLLEMLNTGLAIFVYVVKGLIVVITQSPAQPQRFPMSLAPSACRFSAGVLADTPVAFSLSQCVILFQFTSTITHSWFETEIVCEFMSGFSFSFSAFTRQLFYSTSMAMEPVALPWTTIVYERVTSSLSEYLSKCRQPPLNTAHYTCLRHVKDASHRQDSYLAYRSLFNSMPSGPWSISTGRFNHFPLQWTFNSIQVPLAAERRQPTRIKACALFVTADAENPDVIIAAVLVW